MKELLSDLACSLGMLFCILPLITRNSQTSHPLPSTPRSPWTPSATHPCFTYSTEMVSPEDAFNDILLAQACFKCPPQTPHFPNSSSFDPHYQQPHFFSLFKKHWVPLLFCASEAILPFPSLSTKGPALNASVWSETFSLSSRCCVVKGRGIQGIPQHKRQSYDRWCIHLRARYHFHFQV